MKGGARSRSGPAPDPMALRRSLKSDGEWTKLPASGRLAPAPPWPLVEQSEREAVLWEREWRRPQALMWERNGQELEVALYVRRLTEAEVPASPVTLSTVVRQLQEGLALTVPGLRNARWTIVDDEPAEDVAPPPRASSRGRLTVVATDASAGA